MTMSQARGPEQEDSRSRSTTIPSQQRSAPAERPEGSGSPRRPLRICVVSCEFLGPFRNGGIGTCYTRLAELLNEAGHDVTLLYTQGRHSHTEPIEHWIRVYRRRGIRFVPLPESTITISSNTHELGISYRVSVWLSEHDGFDVVHFPEFGGLGYYSVLGQRQGLMFRQTTSVVGLHASAQWVRVASQQLSHSEKDLEADFIERRSAELADVVWSPSQYMVDWVRAHGWDLRNRTHIQPCIGPPASGPGAEGPVREIVFFGRQEVRKGLLLFLDTIDHLARSLEDRRPEDLVVTILGKPTLIAGRDSGEIIRRRAERWPFPLHVLPDRDPEQALNYLRGEGRLAVMPSLVENSPSAVLECLICRIPFLASRIGGTPELIATQDVDRVCFDPEPRSLAKRLRRALREGQAPARLAFDPEENCRQWVRWHERLVGQGRGAAAPGRAAGGHPDAAAPSVSVCIAHYNRPHLLRQALDSIVAQLEPPLEVIVVDDGSPAPVQPELEAIARDYDFPGRGWRLIRQENRFLGAARNRAVAEAKGDYLLFMDDDNVARPHEIAALIRVARQTGADVLTCLGDTFESGHAPGIHVASDWRWLASGPNQPMSLLYNTFGDANALIRRAAFLEVGGYTEDYGVGHEDWELYARLMLKGYKLEYIPEALFWYRWSTPGCLQTSTPLQRNFLRSLRPHRDLIPEAYHAFFEMCIGQSLVNRGLLCRNEPAPPPPPVPTPAPPWPLRYRLVDGLNARLKRLTYLHRAGKASIQSLLHLRRRILDGRSIRSEELSPAGAGAAGGLQSRLAPQPASGASGLLRNRRTPWADREASTLRRT
jgi:GT2 family glycosyltransferase/glycosyltransferase involved in cell wall biosynthesis